VIDDGERHRLEFRQEGVQARRGREERVAVSKSEL
jgi:hypothetical protein